MTLSKSKCQSKQILCSDQIALIKLRTKFNSVIYAIIAYDLNYLLNLLTP